MLLDLTIAIPVLNEEKNLEGCLNAIGTGFAKEVVLIDSGSTDGTKLIAGKHDIKVFDFKWDGKFPKKRNWFLRNHAPATKWVLFLDADEYLTDDFKNELRTALTGTDKVAFWLNYTIYFLGKKLRGGYPLKKLALFQVGAGEYEYIEEEQWSRLDMEIHEHPIITGKIGTIRSKIDHRDYNPISRYVTKHNEYATWEANRFIKLSSQQKSDSHLTWKQRIKYKLVRSPFAGPFYFANSFILMGGFIDGARGMVFAILKMSYFTQIYCKIKEKK